MTINSDTLVSITEANQNFSKVARLVDEKGSAIILKNNVPKYIVIEFQQADDMMLSDATVMDLSKKLLDENREAYKELAK